MVCNEYCGIGHHLMLGKIYVKEKNGTVRICPDSGFCFDKSAESLMKANAVAGAVCLLIAGFSVLASS